MEYYERAVKNFKSARSKQIAAALLVSTADKLQNGVSQQLINQFLHDPELQRKGRHQVAKYLVEAANLRNDEFVAPLYIQAACFMSDFDEDRLY